MNTHNKVKGSQGYVEALREFTAATLAIDFFDLHHDFLAYLPEKPCRVLDIGAGIGRDAGQFARMGHFVIAVEPTKEYRETGQKMFPSETIKWVDDALPELSTIDCENHFDFIIASAVFHHLDTFEQYSAIKKISELLNNKGIFVVSLRNGPAGIGTHTFPINNDAICSEAESNGLITLLRIEKLPSLMQNKEKVTWSKLVFQKQKR